MCRLSTQMDYGVNQSKNQTDWTAGAGSLSNPFDPVFLELCGGQALLLMTCGKRQKAWSRYNIPCRAHRQ